MEFILLRSILVKVLFKGENEVVKSTSMGTHLKKKKNTKI